MGLQMAKGIPWSDRGDPRHNVPIARLMLDSDARFRPNAKLTKAVGRGGVLDRFCVPVLNTLTDKGIPTVSSCIGVHNQLSSGSDYGHINILGIGAREVDALRAIQQPGMEMRLFYSTRRPMASLTWGVEHK